MRYGILAPHILASLSYRCRRLPSVPIYPEMTVAEFWNTSLSAVNALMGIYFYMYVPCSFVALYLIVNHLGLHRGLITGAVMNAIGAFIRYYYMDNYNAVYLGTFICAAAQTFIVCMPPLIASSWFGSSERSTATSIGVLANQLGTAIGLGVVVVVDLIERESEIIRDVGDDYYEFPIDQFVTHLVATKLERYLAVQLIVAVSALILIAVLGADRPPTPPSAAAELLQRAKSTVTDTSRNTKSLMDEEAEDSNGRLQGLNKRKKRKKTHKEVPWQLLQIQRTFSDASSATSYASTLESKAGNDEVWEDEIVLQAPTYGDSLRQIWRSASNRSFVMSYGVAMGVFYTIPTFLSQLTPRWWHSSWNGWLGVFYQLTGVLGAYSCGKILDATQMHRLLAMVVLVLAAISLLILTGSLKAEQNRMLQTNTEEKSGSYFSWVADVGVVIGVIGTGFTLASWNSVGIELGTGLAYPADEAAVTGVLEASAELFGFAWVTIGGALIETDASAFTAVLSSVICIGIFLLWTLNGEIKRPK